MNKIRIIALQKIHRNVFWCDEKPRV